MKMSEYDRYSEFGGQTPYKKQKVTRDSNRKRSQGFVNPAFDSSVVLREEGEVGGGLSPSDERLLEEGEEEPPLSHHHRIRPLSGESVGSQRSGATRGAESRISSGRGSLEGESIGGYYKPETLTSYHSINENLGNIIAGSERRLTTVDRYERNSDAENYSDEEGPDSDNLAAGVTNVSPGCPSHKDVDTVDRCPGVEPANHELTENFDQFSHWNSSDPGTGSGAKTPHPQLLNSPLTSSSGSTSSIGREANGWQRKPAAGSPNRLKLPSDDLDRISNAPSQPEDPANQPPRSKPPLRRSPPIPVELLQNRKRSEMEDRYSRKNHRSNLLQQLRQEISRIATNSCLNLEQLSSLLGDTNFTQLLFQLFDSEKRGKLVQSLWIGKLKAWTKSMKTGPGGQDLVDMLEAVSYIVCQDEDLSPQDFHKVISTRGMSRKVLTVVRELDKSGTGTDERVRVEALMDTFLYMTHRDKEGRCRTEEFNHQLEKVFKENLGPDATSFTLDQFRKIVQCKDDFFVNRIFSVFDTDQSGTVSLAEFCEGMDRFSGNDADSKIEFLFKVYDSNNDELLDEEEYGEVIQACMRENGMEFDDEEIMSLTNAIFQDGVQEGAIAMTLDDFKAQMQREEGLLENLSSMINRWILPEKKVSRPSRRSPLHSLCTRYLSSDYLTKNKSLLTTILCILVINAALFIQRAHYFKDFSMLNGLTPNPFYLLSRACGRTLLFNSVLVLVLVLRYTITLLRKFGLASVLPLDHNIYLHKIVGVLIFMQSALHTIMHICNFAINIQPDPVKFVQITGYYWEDHGPYAGYQPPPGCQLVGPDDDLAQDYCSPTAFQAPDGMTLSVNITLCQACPNGTEWTYNDWMTTTRPGMLGLVPGCANPTGIALIISLTVMVLCALPVVRRSGHFEVFYMTHTLYLAYFILLIFHAPDFWKWLLGPAILWLGEMTYRQLTTLFGHGKTYVTSGVLLPSKVTNLVIQRPPGFKFSPGDWVFIKIPAVARSEWHPFTISSCPEVEGYFTLHIRGVGGWTNSLHQFFDQEFKRQNAGLQKQASMVGAMYGSMKKKWKSVKNVLPTNNKGGEEETFASLANRYNTVDPEKQRKRMEQRAEKLGMRNRDGDDAERDEVTQRSLASVRYLSMKHKIIRYNESNISSDSNSTESNITSDVMEDLQIHQSDVENGNVQIGGVGKQVGKKTKLEKPLAVYVDGPFGSPSSNFYRAEHAVLIGTGIGVTPFASILQSIMHRYWKLKHTCPRCELQWSDNLEQNMFNLKKVDFFWINRDQKSFEWFVNLLSQLEMEQAVQGGEMERFLDMHMYVTSALQKTDMKAVSLQLALDILHRKEDRDLVTGLKSRTNAGRPNFDKIFSQLRNQQKGKVTVFYCGNPALARTVRLKCEQFGFTFRKEVF